MTVLKFKLGRTEMSVLATYLEAFDYVPGTHYILLRRYGPYQLVRFLVPVEKDGLLIFWDVFYANG